MCVCVCVHVCVVVHVCVSARVWRTDACVKRVEQRVRGGMERREGEG